IQAYAFTDARGVYVPAAEVEERTGSNGELTFWYEGEQVNREYGKIGKSLKNSVMPDEMYDAYGADTFRVYEMSMGPLEQDRPWETRAVVGAHRFLQRVWRLFVDETSGRSVVRQGQTDDESLKVLHQVIDGVREDMDHLRFNTAISKLIVLTNHATKQGGATAELLEPLTIMLAPFAPHLAEELWQRLGHESTVTYAKFPEADPDYLVADTVTCVVQVKGKVRARLEVAPDLSEETQQGGATAELLEPLTIMLAPFAPHLAEELWQRLGHESTVTYAKFPEADPDYLVADTVTCVVQVKGKVRARLEVAPDISEEALE